jgi:hypothetical protein
LLNKLFNLGYDLSNDFILCLIPFWICRLNLFDLSFDFLLCKSNLRYAISFGPARFD